MRHQELNLEPQSYNFNCNTYPKGSHCRLLLMLGRCLPSTKSQANYFIKVKAQLDVLNIKDVQDVEALLNKHGFEGDYKYTKSGQWVRLVNYNDLYSALKLEF